MYNFHLWRTILGKTDTFGGWRNGDTAWYKPLRYKLTGLDYHVMTKDRIEILETGDYKNNFIVIEVGVINGEPTLPYLDEGGNEQIDLELAHHIQEHIWTVDDPREAAHFWKSSEGSDSDYDLALKSKDEIKEHLIMILGEMVFNAVKDGKVKLLINSSSEMSSKTLIEFILYICEYAGIKKEYVTVMVNNITEVDTPQITCWDYFLIESHHDLRSIFQLVYSSFPFDDEYFKYLSEYKKPKRYLCYNANLHGHRLFVLCWLIGKKLEEFGLISAINRSESDAKELFNQLEFHLFDSRETNHNIEAIRESDHPLNFTLTALPILIEKLPLLLDIDEDYLLGENDRIVHKLKKVYGEFPEDLGNYNWRTDRYIHTEHFTDTYFSIVTETTWEHFNWGTDNSVRVTEKIYKDVALHPFIVIGNKNTLQYLKSLGFETFPEMFDESYDKIDDPVDRMIFVMKEVERLCDMDIEELHKIYVSVLPKIRHNQEVFMNMDREKLFFEKVKESLE